MTGLILLSSAEFFLSLYNGIHLFYCLVLFLEWVSVSSMPRLFLSLVSVTRAKRGFRCFGIRGSVELIGGASCSLLVGQLLKIHWTLAFLIYGFGFIILAMYLLCTTDGADREERDTKK